ncbi:MAG: FAD-dependent oxidoreductase [Oscillospiraceae bacterium]|nr:FAD-dependent oxidoreductase [Oscillospiraceae bacterium]
MCKVYDIAVVGSGPAGLTAALYARRAGKSVIVIEKENFGGQITFSPKIENYPTAMEISGAEFAEKLMTQAEAHGTVLEMDNITAIAKDAQGFTLTGEYGSYQAKSVILATGSKHRTLGLPHEAELTGHGVCYCAVCDGAFFRDQDVAVIGGGNTALQDAVFLSDICTSVTIVQNLPELTGDPVLQERVSKLENVSVICDATVDALLGEGRLNGIRILKGADKTPEVLSVTGMFAAIGQQPENGAFAEFAALDPAGYIISDENCKTGTEGLFAAGDCRTKAIRQVVTATADGASAALAACRYLDR